MPRTPTIQDCIRSSAKASGSLQRIELNVRYIMDIVAEDSLVVEVKAVDPANPIHQAQLASLSPARGYRFLLLNFNRPTLKDGITRMRL